MYHIQIQTLAQILPKMGQNHPKLDGDDITVPKQYPKGNLGTIFQNFIFDHFPQKLRPPLGLFRGFRGLSFKKFQIQPQICYHMKDT